MSRVVLAMVILAIVTLALFVSIIDGARYTSETMRLYAGQMFAAQEQADALSARTSFLEKTVDDLSAKLDALQKERVQSTSVIVDSKTEKIRYDAMGPSFLEYFWKVYGEVNRLRDSLGGHGYGPDGHGGWELLPVEYDTGRAFDAKIHSAEFLVKSGHTEAARALFLSALADRSIVIGGCSGPVESKEFSEQEVPVGLLSLLEGSPYHAELTSEVHNPGTTYSYTEERVLIGVGKNFIKGC